MLPVKEDPKLGEELARRSNEILKVCEALAITDDYGYAEADKRASETKSLEKGVEDYWEEPKMWAHKAWKSICNKEKQMILPSKEGGRLLTKKMSAYRQDREALEAEKRKKEEEKKRLEMVRQAILHFDMRFCSSCLVYKITPQSKDCGVKLWLYIMLLVG